MATFRLPILTSNGHPDTSGEVFWQPYSLIDTSPPTIDPLVLTFNNSGTKDGFEGQFTVPQNYVGTANLVIVWTSSLTSNNPQFDWSVLTRSGTEDMGDGTTRATETGAGTVPGTAFLRVETTIALTDGDYAAGDNALFTLFRDSVTDSHAAPIAVFAAYFEYDDA